MWIKIKVLSFTIIHKIICNTSLIMNISAVYPEKMIGILPEDLS